jgi:hypothetical protein
VLSGLEDGVSTEELVRALTHQDDFDSHFPALLVKESGRHRPPVCEEIVKIPGDLFEVVTYGPRMDRDLQVIRADVLSDDSREGSFIEQGIREPHADRRDTGVTSGESSRNARIEAPG